MEYTIKRKSIQKKKIKVEFIKVNNLNCLLFTLEKPNHQVIMGATNILSFIEADRISEKISAIFYNATREYVYCLLEDIQRELRIAEKEYIKG